MIQDTTSATTRLDWLRSHLVLALQELQGWLDSQDGIAAFIDPQDLNDLDICMYQPNPDDTEPERSGVRRAAAFGWRL